MLTKESLQKLYFTHHPALLSYAVYLVKNQEDASELINDVFVKIWEKREKQIEPNNWKYYLFTATKHTCLNHLRKEKGKIQEFLDFGDEKPQNLEANKLELIELQDKINYLISCLPTRCKQVFLLSRISEMSNKEIADLMDISVKTVENQMTKALLFLKKNLSTT